MNKRNSEPSSIEAPMGGSFESSRSDMETGRIPARRSGRPNYDELRGKTGNYMLPSDSLAPERPRFSGFSYGT